MSKCELFICLFQQLESDLHNRLGTSKLVTIVSLCLEDLV